MTNNWPLTILLTPHGLSAPESYNSTVLPFVKRPYLTLLKGRWWLTKGHHLNIFGKARMLHTKFQGHLPFISWNEEFQILLTLYGHERHLGHVTKIPEQTLIFQLHRGATYNSFSISSAVSSGVISTESEGPKSKVSKWSWPLISIKVCLTDYIIQP